MSSPNDQCPSYETRSAVQIAWSCIAIIFACTWTAVHPNVPPASVSTSQWRMAWRRIKMMLWTILLPDLMMVEASIQRARARRISEVANRKVAGPPSEQSDTTSCVGAQSPLEPVLQDTEASNHNPPSALFETTPPAVPIHQWTRTHSYFLVMGGFAVANEDKPGSWTTVSVSDVLDGRIPWPSVKEGDILNGSKGDAFSKTLVILQATWFFVQLYARIFYNLRITELEWVTLWYAYFCASLYVAWFKKPYDVHQPIVLPDRNAELPKVNRPHSSQISNFLSGGWVWEVHSRIVDASACGPGLADTAKFLFTNAVIMGGFSFVLWWCFVLRRTTRLEVTLWLSASVCALAIPLVYFLLIFIFEKLSTSSTPLYIKKISSIFVAILFNIYFIARIILFVQSFIFLRDLHPLAIPVIPWTTYLPHI